MSRKKTIKKAKEPVRIRFKSLANGNQSIYLDIYHNGERRYKFLKLYLVPVTDANRHEAETQNANTLQAANALKAKMIIDLANGNAGIVKKSEHEKILLVDWMEYFREQKKKMTRGGGYVSNIDKTILHLKEYKGSKVTLGEVNKAYCNGFLDYLANAKSMKDKGKSNKEKAEKELKDKAPILSKYTQGLYCTIFNTAMKMAVREGMMQFNPMERTDTDKHIKRGESERVYLDESELKAMMETECSNEMTKAAFIFSCYCGLRISDIRGLKWGNLKAVEKPNGGKTYNLSIVMQKTQRGLNLTLPQDALKYLPPREAKGDDENVFPSLPKYQWNINSQLKVWAAKAGVKKNVSFHTARHTFATLLLTKDADIYTTSKLLGHTRIATTEIYAKIIDKKKDEAMSLLDGVF